MPEETKLAALVVRNIRDIEAAFTMAEGALDEQFHKEVMQATEATAVPIWTVKADSDDEPAWLTKQDWLADDGKEKEFWLSFGELPGANDELDGTWIATASGSGPNCATFILEFCFLIKAVTPARFKKLLNNNPELVARLKNNHFDRDESHQRMFIRVNIDPDALAVAFEEEDFDAALAPVRKAVEDAMAAQKDLDKLVELLRTKANA